MSAVIELARFKVDAAAEADFLSTRPAMVRAVCERVPGLKEISLVRLDDDTWVDVVIWENRAAAERGAEIAGGLPEVREWMHHIAADLSMDLGEIVDRERGAASDLRPSGAGDEVRR